MEPKKNNGSKVPYKPESKYWCFTINNYTEEDKPIFHQMEYLIYGREKGSVDNNLPTPHYQGFVVMINKKRLTAMKKLFPRAHLEIMRGTTLEASTYCKKDMDYDEFGELPLARGKAGGEATQEKWYDAKKLAQEGNLEDIDPQIYIQAYNTLKTIKRDHQDMPEDLDWKDNETPNEWIWGPSGTGKSRKARLDNPGVWRFV